MKAALGLVLTLVLPILVAAVDTVATSLEDGGARLAPLHEGERFVFDAYFESHEHRLSARVPAYLRIEVGTVDELRLLNGETRRVLPYTETRGLGPWHQIQAATVLQGSLLEHRVETVTRYIDVERGITVESHWHRQQTLAKEGASTPRRPLEFGEVHAPAQTPFQWGMAPGMGLFGAGDAFSNAVADLGRLRLPGKEVALLEGREVRNILTWSDDEPTVSTHPLVTCSLFFPEERYQDFALGRRLDGRPVWSREINRAWVNESVALPQLSTCHHVLRLGDQDGELIEDVRLSLVLVHHARSGPPVPIKLHHYDRHDPSGGLRASAVQVRGVPAGGGASIDISFEEALAALRSQGKEPIRTFLAAPEELVVQRATYAPRVQAQNAGTLGPADPLLSAVSSRDPIVRKPMWQLWIAKPGTSTQVWATVETSVHKSGIRDPFAVRDGFQNGTEPWKLGEAPKAQVSLEDLVADWGRRADVPSDALKQASHGLEVSHEAGSHVVRFISPNQTKDVSYRLHDGLVLRSVPEARPLSAAAAPPAAPKEQAQLMVRVDEHIRPVTLIAAGVLAVGLGGAALWLRGPRWLGRLVALGLYAKVERDRVLEHPNREAIVATLRVQAGLSTDDLRQRLAVGNGTIQYHLAVLQQNGVLMRRDTGRETCWFLPGQIDASSAEGVALLRSPATQRVYQALAAHPDATQDELAKALSINRVSVRFQLRRMMQAGLVLEDGGTRPRRYRVASNGTEAYAG